MRTIATLIVLSMGTARADGPKDNLPDNVRPVPPVGIGVPEDVQVELDLRLKILDGRLKELRKQSHPLLPDVEIYERAVRQAIEHKEIYTKRDVWNLPDLLFRADARAQELSKPGWATKPGLLVRGFRSRLDDTVQPYGLVIPESYTEKTPHRYRLDVWLHGRGERSSESVFIAERLKKPGIYTPEDTIVLHPYGRYSNAFKFAGEVDVLEAIEHVKEHYRIDEDRISIRGFSMGGAGCWQMAVHYPGMWFAANPGAGFSETPEFLKFFQREDVKPTWYEEKLWRMYDCPGYAGNLFNLPTVAYSGELDIQKQAADVMEKALESEGMRLTHVIGPKTKHAIEKNAQRIVEEKMSSLAEVGRDRVPSTVKLNTFTLKYDRSHWLSVTGLVEHWERSFISASLSKNTSSLAIVVDCSGVSSFRIALPAGRSPFRPALIIPKKLHIVINGSLTLKAPFPETDRSFACDVHLTPGGKWKLGPPPEGLRKRHDLQGPIDDAFMNRFIVVRPTGKGAHELTDKWARSELDHFVKEWRRQFRGDAIVKDDKDITAKDIESANLILFGDPKSNSVMASVMKDLPIGWGDETVTVGDRTYDAAHHAPVMIHPNPKNPDRYVVLNSGFTYREYAYLNNARQVPKLPDWAVIDVRTPADSLWPGKVVEAGFFDEEWKLK